MSSARRSPRHSRRAVLRWALAAAAMVLLTVPALPGQATPGVRQQEWPLDARHFDAAAVWRLSQGAGVTVAVLDSGVQANHPDLSGQVLPGASFVTAGQDDARTDPSSDSHGTSIAGIVAGTGQAGNGTGMVGLAPKAKILPVRVSVGGSVTTVALAKGILYAVDHHARVLNISIGAANPDPNIRQAVAYAVAHGTIVVAAAGNRGQDGNPPQYPANFPGVVDVSGLDDQGRFWSRSESGARTTLGAPATGITSTDNQGHYLRGDGTSYAAPYVSATAALIWSEHPQLTAGQVLRQLLGSADPARAGSRAQFGYGILDPLRALRATPPAATGNPLLSTSVSHGSRSHKPSSTILVAAVAAGAVTAAVAAGCLLLYRRRRRVTRSAKNTRPSTRRPATGRARRPARRRR